MASRHGRRLWFVDECGTHIALRPLYARSPRGQRAVGSVRRSRGTVTTLIAALTLDGLGAAFALEGGVDGDAFEVYVREVLVPVLSPGDVVVWDNLGAHKDSRARALVEGRGCEVVFLPAYSPDLTPVELAFSKVKALLRRAGARTREALLEAIARALDAVTAKDAAGWFRHCGYQPAAQPL